MNTRIPVVTAETIADNLSEKWTEVESFRMPHDSGTFYVRGDGGHYSVTRQGRKVYLGTDIHAAIEAWNQPMEPLPVEPDRCSECGRER